jgi:predicted PurR-regulated permease PerM
MTRLHPGVAALVGLIAIVAALRLAQEVLVPLAIAGLVAFLLAPLVARVQRLGMPRAPAVVVVMALALLVAAASGVLVVRELKTLVDRLPAYEETLRAKADSIRTNIAGPLQRASRTVSEIAQTGVESRPVAEAVPVSFVDPSPLASMLAPAGRIAGVLGWIGLVVVLASIALIGKESVRNRLIRLAGGGHLSATTLALDEAAAKVSRYLLLACLVNGSLGLCAGLTLFAIGVPNALLWGILFALLRFIPYVGVWIGAALPVTTALAVSSTWTQPLLAIGIFVVLELVTANVIEPWLYGARTGVSSGALIVAAVFWTWVWGIPGLLLSTPLTVCLAVVGKHVPPLRFLHVLLGNEPALPVHARLCQRLLAGDSDEALEIVDAELARGDAMTVLDGTILPALGIAARERDEGAIDEASFEAVVQAMSEIIQDVADRAPKPKEGGSSSAVPLLCVGASDAADDAVAALCADLLAREGFVPVIARSSLLTGEVVKAALDGEVRAILVSCFPPAGLTRVRYLCKRLVAASEPAQIIVGVWGPEPEAARATARLPEVSGLRVVATLAAAVEQARHLIGSLSVETTDERTSHVAVRSPGASL